MQTILNTLYVMTQGAYVHLDHETVCVKTDQKKLQVPLHHLGSIVTFGNVLLSSALLSRCAKDNRLVVMLDNNGRFLCRVEGPVSGNVLLRCAQHDTLNQQNKVITIARNIVAGKIQNCRQIVQRGAREAETSSDNIPLRMVSNHLAGALRRLKKCNNLNGIRGIEGEAAKAYFSVFNNMIKCDREIFYMYGRNKRPPRDRVNALLSFLYTLLANDSVGALQGVGLDPQVGFLHTIRPGRASLAFDLMEELRPVLADRLALTLINRRQIVKEDFEPRYGGAVYLSADGRKKVVAAYQKRKQEEIKHPFLERKIPLGFILHVQARILARYLRGDMEEYIPFIYK